MKILYLNKTSLISSETHTMSILNFCYAISKFGIDIKLATPCKNNVTEKEIKNHYGINKKKNIIKSFQPLFIKNLGIIGRIIEKIYIAYQFRNLIKKIEPEIIYSRLTVLELLLIPKDSTLYYEMHSLGTPENNFIYKFFFKYLIIPKITRVIVTTETLKHQLFENYPKIKEIRVASLSAPSPSKSNYKFPHDVKLHLKNNLGQLIGYTGFLDKEVRGISTILKLAEVLPEYTFIIAGGPEEVKNYWVKKAKQNNLKNIFFLGWISQIHIGGLVQKCHIVLSPLNYRPLPRAPIGQNMSPLKIPFYMSYSSAIIASDIPSHQHYIKHKYNGLLAEPENINSWISNILKLKNKKLYKTLSENSYKTYIESFTENARIRKIFYD